MHLGKNAENRNIKAKVSMNDPGFCSSKVLWQRLLFTHHNAIDSFSPLMFMNVEIFIVDHKIDSYFLLWGLSCGPTTNQLITCNNKVINIGDSSPSHIFDISSILSKGQSTWLGSQVSP